MGLQNVYLCVVGIYVGLARQSGSFNVDVRTAKVLAGLPSSGFGLTAEFIRQKNETTRLLVGAPNGGPLTNGDRSGMYYTCDISTLTCTQATSTSQATSTPPGGNNSSAMINVALNKPAQQSSTESKYYAGLAVDGNTSTDYNQCSLTDAPDSLPNRWWRVDLQGLFEVEAVKITNTHKTWGYTLADFDVYVMETLQDPSEVAHDRKDLCVHRTVAITLGATERLNCNSTLTGRHVSLVVPNNKSRLIVCEVQVLGRPVSVRNASSFVFGEQFELFGLALTMADPTKAVVCDPLWSDISRWSQDLDFNIGRCQILTAQDGKEGVTHYNKSIQLEGRESRQMYYYYGRAEFGFSADGDGKGRVVIGAPGISDNRGGLVILDIRVTPSSYAIMELILDPEPEPDVALGYSVAVGNFCGSKRFCFVASNREVKGEVYLLERGLPRPLRKFKSEQAYSSFGSALCAADVSGDGWADLLVGAPTHTVQGSGSRSYDQGRVFVYISQGNVLVEGQDKFHEGAALTGDSISFSGFGSAISSIGDIDRDSISDIAVGAPMAEGGAGAVYIYLGSRGKGPANKYSQKIRGKDFSPALTSFGAHISKPTSDLSPYHYPDFAVGAPLSHTVVFFQTRLVVNAYASVKATPNPVEKTNDLCPKNMQGPYSGCLKIRMCLRFIFSIKGLSTSTAAKYRSLVFNVVLEVDQLIMADDAQRVRLFTSTGGITTHQVELVITRTSEVCLNYQAVLKKEQINRNPFVPVQITARFQLNTTSFTDIAPILNQSIPTSASEQLIFNNKCGKVNRCNADLVLTGHVDHVPPSDVSYPFNVINDTKQVDLVLHVLNTGETSFGLSLHVRLTGRMDFWTPTGNTTVLCDDLEEEEDAHVLRCRGWNPLPKGEAVLIRLKFLAHTVPLEPENRLVTFHVEVMPFSQVSNPEQNRSDNVETLESRTAIVANVRLNGSSTPAVTCLSHSSQNDVSVTHKLLVTNRGPSFLPPTLITIRLPYQDGDGSLLLDSAHVTIKYPEGETLDCTPCGVVIGGSTRRGEGSSASGGGLDILNRRGRRREVGEGEEERVKMECQKSSAAAEQSGDGGGETLRLDCGNCQCAIYQCPLPVLQAAQSAEINVCLTLLRDAFIFPGNEDSVLYVTTSSVKEPDLALFYPWNQPRIRQVVTHIKRASGGGQINIWYVIGSVLGGLLLLLIVGLLLWRFGFFQRKDKAKLERLKRQMGFYDKPRASSQRKSQRASTSSDNAREKED